MNFGNGFDLALETVDQILDVISRLPVTLK